MTRANHRPDPSRGWQTTPGQPIPRAARQPAANGLLLVMVQLVWFSPLSIVVWLLGQAVILLQRRWHWWRFTLASVVAIAVVLAVTGPQEALRRHIFVPQHFWFYEVAGWADDAAQRTGEAWGVEFTEVRYRRGLQGLPGKT
jgi:hypothetical protein